MITVSFCISRSIDLELPGNNEHEIIEEFKKSPFYKHLLTQIKQNNFVIDEETIFYEED